MRLLAGDVVIELTRIKDRFGHRLGVAQDGEVTWFLESVEGTEEEDWPSSPPLQELSCERQGTGRDVALLVGMAGKSHWSVSVEADVASQRLRFDVACRTHVRPVWLGSSYRLLGPVRAESSRAICAERVELALGEVSEAKLEVLKDQVRVAVAGDGERWPQTFRWSYEVGLARGGT